MMPPDATEWTPGTTLNLPDETANRGTFGLPGTRLTALVELGTRVAWACHGPCRAEERPFACCWLTRW